MIDNIIDCDNPVYGKTGIMLTLTAGGMKALNEWVPNVDEINEWVIMLSGVLGAVLLFFKIRSIIINTRYKKYEIEKMKREIEKISSENEAKK